MNKPSTKVRGEKKVEIEHFYREEDGTVIRYWRYEGEKDWRGETTPYSEIPYSIYKNNEKI
jgi:hypothetical protein